MQKLNMSFTDSPSWNKTRGDSVCLVGALELSWRWWQGRATGSATGSAATKVAGPTPLLPHLSQHGCCCDHALLHGARQSQAGRTSAAIRSCRQYASVAGWSCKRAHHACCTACSG